MVVNFARLTGRLVFRFRLRADKPRRALPSASGDPALTRFDTGRLRSLAKRGATAVVVSGLAVAGFSAFTASSTNSAGTAFADQGLAISSIPAVQAASATRTASVADLARQRSARLAEESAAINDTFESVAAQARTSALAGSADVITAEIKRLKNLAKFLWPTEGGVGSPYGMRLHPILRYYRLHDGDDIGGRCGQPIYAAQSGVVVKAATGGYNGGSGNNVRINHGDINGVNVQTGYLHMTKVTVSVGQKVDQGDLIGTVGNTGLSTSCHLHFSLYENGRGTDPQKYLGWNKQAGAKDHAED